MLINKDNKIIIMKLLNPLISIKISKLIPMILLTSILAISFSLGTSSNAFASLVQDTPVATYTYPDNWMIVGIQRNGEVISFQPINEPMVFVYKTVYRDFSNAFGQIVDKIMQNNINNGFEISIRNNEPGSFWFDRYDGTGLGYIWIGQVDNDVVVTEYFADPSKAQQYGDPRLFYVETKPSVQEVNRGQSLNNEMEYRNELYKLNMKAWENFGDSFRR